MKRERIALKPYLETIESYCNGLSKEELKEVIMSFGKDVSTSGRAAFLESLESFVPGLKPYVKQHFEPIDEILNDIAALRESIVERLISIEDGSFWDDPDLYEDDYGYDDEDPDSLSDEQESEILSFFDDAGRIFLLDHLADARKVYEALFNLINVIKKYDDYFEIRGYDIREARARYCRAVYEASINDNRLYEFADAMDIEHHRINQELQYDESFPLLQDVVDARPGEMAGLETFLIGWKKLLSNKGLNGRPAGLFLEAVYRTEGIIGVSALARKWNNSQPMGYLFWLKVLKSENSQGEIINVGNEALKTLEAGRSREQVAGFMIEAAHELDENGSVLLGKREKFYSRFNDRNLLDLMEEATKQNERDNELDKVISFLRDLKADGEEKELFVRSILMAGKLDEAVSLAANEKSVGWSYSSIAGVVFGSVLSVLTDYSDKAGTVKIILKNYADKTSIYSEEIIVRDRTAPSFYSEILKGLGKNKDIKSQAEDALSWAEKIGKKRIDHIVSNQHRNAYERAARILGALAETYLLMGKQDKAKKIINRFYVEKYNRHSAFRREVQDVINNSNILKDQYIHFIK